MTLKELVEKLQAELNPLTESLPVVVEVDFKDFHEITVLGSEYSPDNLEFYLTLR